MCVESHSRERIEPGIEVQGSEDARGAPKHPTWGYGYMAALINYAYLAHAVLHADEVVQARSDPDSLRSLPMKVRTRYGHDHDEGRNADLLEGLEQRAARGLQPRLAAPWGRRRAHRALAPRALDGKGYPDGLAGDDIPKLARIVAVADTFDAMTSDRPYRKGMPAEVAFEEVARQAGKQFDPEIAQAFLSIRAKVLQEMQAQTKRLATQLGGLRLAR